MKAVPEYFRWEARDRVTGTIYKEDESGLTSFTQLKAGNLDQLSLYRTASMVVGLTLGVAGIHLAIPEGATAVFTRRRKVEFDAHSYLTASVDGIGDTTIRPGWTIIGYRWPDGSGLFHFFENWGEDRYFTSPNFNAV